MEQDDSRAYKEFRALVTSKLCAQVSHIKDINIEVPKAIADLARKNKLDGWVRASGVAPAPVLSAEPKIEVSTAPNAPYHITELQQGHVLSTVRIGVRNAGGKTLSNCKVYVEQINPAPDIPGADRKLLGHGPFRLRYDDPEELVDIAAHWDHIDKFRFSTPLPTGAFPGDPFDLKDVGERTFVVKVVATECERSAQFLVRTDEAKRLHLSFLRYID